MTRMTSMLIGRWVSKYHWDAHEFSIVQLKSSAILLGCSVNENLNRRLQQGENWL